MFREKLAEVTARRHSVLCVGLDVDPRLAPPSLVGQDGWVERFCLGIVEATADLVCAFKPNLAFFEALGEDGYRGLRRTLDGLPKDVVSIGDAKRGDIGSTAEAYARALYEVWGFDVVTVSPLLGPDTLQPFLAYKDRGIFVLCKTSNPAPGASRICPSREATATHAALRSRSRARWWRWTLGEAAGQIGLVIGATYPAQLARDPRARARSALPGAGRRGAAGRRPGGRRGRAWTRTVAGSSSTPRAGSPTPASGADWQTAARDAALALRERLEAARQEVRPATDSPDRRSAGAADRACGAVTSCGCASRTRAGAATSRWCALAPTSGCAAPSAAGGSCWRGACWSGASSGS